MSTPKIKLLFNRVLVKPQIEDKVSAGGIILVENGPPPPVTRGTVVIVGPGTKDYEMQTKVGDLVQFSAHSGAEIILEDGITYIIMRETEITMVLN